jgi:chromosome segregation ATPase
VKGSTKPVSDTSRIDQLQAENRKLKSELESIRHEKESTWKSTEAQYLQEIQDLKAKIQIQNEMLSSKMMSELDRVKGENDILNANLDSLKDSLAEKLIDIDELKSQVLEAENQMSLTELRNDDLKKSITDSLQANQELIADRDNAILTALNSAKLADEKVAALSEALSTLQEAATRSKEATSYENTAEHLLKDGPTKTKGNRIGKWHVKHGFKTPKNHQESEQIKLMENTGLWMVESAQNLHEQAINVKVKGKQLKKEAKKLSRQ